MSSPAEPLIQASPLDFRLRDVEARVVFMRNVLSVVNKALLVAQLASSGVIAAGAAVGLTPRTTALLAAVTGVATGVEKKLKLESKETELEVLRAEIAKLHVSVSQSSSPQADESLKKELRRVVFRASLLCQL